MFGIFILASLAFLYIFWKVNFLLGVYLVGFFLSIFFVLSFFTQEWKQTWKAFLKNFIITYLSYLNLVLVLVGLFFILKYFLVSYPYSDLLSLMMLLGVLTLFFVVATLFWKINLIKIIYFGFLFIWGWIWFYIRDIYIFYYFVAFMLAVSALWNVAYFARWWKFYEWFLYVLFISLLVAIFILVEKFFHLQPIGLSDFVQFVVMIILCFLLYLLNLKTKLRQIETIISQYQHELNLFGYAETKISDEDKKFYEKYSSYKYTILKILDFFLNGPDWMKILLAFTNTVPLLFATYYFFSHLGSEHYLQNEVLYWIGAILFFINFLLFKKLNWFVTIQRFFAFFVINFVTYFTIIDFFWHNYLYIALWGILWNLISTVIILFIGQKDFFDWLDYLNWMIVNFLWVFINIYFLWKLSLSFYLNVGIILMYLGAYLFLYRLVYKKVFK